MHANLKRLILLSLYAVGGCSAESMMSMEKDGAWDSGSSDWGDADADADVDSDADADDYDPEEEQDFKILMPAATPKYVFVANPERNTVTRVAVPSLEVITVEVGVRPQTVITSEDYTKAVCFNIGSDELSVIDADSLKVENVEVRPNLNAMELSPNGRWAVAFHDADIVTDEESTGTGAYSFNEVSIVDTVTLIDYPLVVGLNPHQISFTEDSAKAIVVSDESLTVIEFQGDEPSSRMVDISGGSMDPPPAEELAISPEGGFVFVRQFGADKILAVSLDDYEMLEPITVGSNPTDLDVMPDGETVIVISRGSGEIYLLDANDPTVDPVLVDWKADEDVPADMVIGSVMLDPDGETAILYTNATLQDSYLTWDIVSGDFRQRPLVKPISSMAISPTGDSLLVFHTREDAADADPESPYYNRWAISLISLEDFRSNPMTLPAEPSAYAQSDDGLYGF